MIDRQEFLQEVKLRKFIRKGIQIVLETRKNKDKQVLLEEQKLRSLIQNLITEVEVSDNDPAPNKYTGINQLEKLLKKIIPVIEDDFKQLTTSLEQRQSFRSHIINAVENSLAPSKVNKQAVATISENLLDEEDINIEVDEEEAFIDVPRAGGEEEEELDPVETGRKDFGIEGANITGRNMAYETFKQVEKQILSSYDLLEDNEDRDIFYDYLITNLKLYFDKFEDELAPSIEEPTTSQYEKETSMSQTDQLKLA